MAVADYTNRTAWSRAVPTPLREFLRTETGSAVLLLAATVAGLLWVNVDSHSYSSLWTTRVSIQIGDSGIALDVRGWINSGLMTFFFFVIGLEARREFDLGELRDRRRLALPAVAGLGGAFGAVAIYLAINAGRPSAHGWGVAMSTDTAFTLGLLALVGPRFPDRLRAFLLTVAVVDDVVALGVIVLFYSSSIDVTPLVIAIAFYSAVLVLHRARVRVGLAYFVLGAGAWVGLFEAGVEPIVVGLALGVLPYAYPPRRSTLELATERFFEFREQPTAGLARTAVAGLRAATPPNERLQQLYHPWTSYVVVPLFALANAGIVVDGDLLGRAVRSPITLGILFGYLLGKPVGIAGASWLVTRASRGRLRPPVGWAAVLGGGTIAGIGFTVSLLIATIAFDGDRLDEAKAGVLASGLVAASVTWILFWMTSRLPLPVRARALLGSAQTTSDLYLDVDSERDHIRGPVDAPVTLVEYGDFECPFCGLAEPAVRDLLREFGDVGYVWRNLPLSDVHPNAQLAAEAAEAAAIQGRFWEMHDLLLAHQDALDPDDLVRYAQQIGLDVERFATDLRTHAGAARVADDVDSADLSGVSGTPTFFVNGRRHFGAYDLETLSNAVRLAGARAVFTRS
jgi:Na+/H+ antiporter NhaA